MSTLDPHERRDVAPRRGSADLIRRGGQLHVAVAVRELAHGPDQVQGAPKGGAPAVAASTQVEKDAAVRPPPRQRGTSMCPSGGRPGNSGLLVSLGRGGS